MSRGARSAGSEPSPAKLLVAEDVSIERSGRLILAEVDMCISAGRFTVIVGPNGAGKSTLLRVLAGEHRPTRGRVILDGKPIGRHSAKELAERRAFLRQRFSLAAELTVAETVALGRFGRGAIGASTTAALLAEVGLEGLGARWYATLSGGEQQRVHLARALAQLEQGEMVGDVRSAMRGEPSPSHNKTSRAPILLLDEPSSSLDPRHQHAVLSLARERARRGYAVIAVLHDLDLATLYGDEVFVMSNGRIAWQGETTELPAKVLSDVFGIPATSWTDNAGVRRYAWAARSQGG